MERETGEIGKVDDDGSRAVGEDGEMEMIGRIEVGAIAGSRKMGGGWSKVGRVWSGQSGVYSAYKYEMNRARLPTSNWTRWLGFWDV